MEKMFPSHGNPGFSQEAAAKYSGSPMSLSAHILVGPTASGKSAVAHELALSSCPAHPIISADSMAIYCDMDIGTAKPEPQDRAAVPSYGFNLVTPDKLFSVGDYRNSIQALEPELTACGASPIVVGGTGLYGRCLTEGLDSAAVTDPAPRAKAEALFESKGLEALQAATRELNPDEYAHLRDPENPRRVIRAYELLACGHPLPKATNRPHPKIAGLRLNADELRARILRRARQMFAYGLVEEVRMLRERYPTLSGTARKAIGYEEAGRVLDGKISEEEGIRLTAIRTSQYAKRQMTWFRKQADVVWVDVRPDDPPGKIAGQVQRIWTTHGPTALKLDNKSENN